MVLLGGAVWPSSHCPHNGLSWYAGFGLLWTHSQRTTWPLARLLKTTCFACCLQVWWQSWWNGLLSKCEFSKNGLWFTLRSAQAAVWDNGRILSLRSSCMSLDTHLRTGFFDFSDCNLWRKRWPGVRQQTLCSCVLIFSSVCRLPPWGLSLSVCWFFLPYTSKFKEFHFYAERPGGLRGCNFSLTSLVQRKRQWAVLYGLFINYSRKGEAHSIPVIWIRRTKREDSVHSSLTDLYQKSWNRWKSVFQQDSRLNKKHHTILIPSKSLFSFSLNFIKAMARKATWKMIRKWYHFGGIW